MNILISVTNLVTGGPTTFLLRLASALAESNNVFIYDHYPYVRSHSLMEDYPKLRILSMQDNFLQDRFAWGMNAVGEKLSSKIKFWNKANEKNFSKSLLQHKIDVILTTQKKTDLITVKHGRELEIPVVLRLNSSYGIELNKAPDVQIKKDIHDVFSSISGLIYTSDYHYKRLQAFLPESKNYLITKIMNGIPALVPRPEDAILPFEMSDNTFVYGMVSRGHPDKGWQVAIDAFVPLQNESSKDLHLVLVGGGGYMDELSKRYLDSENIHFLGFQSRPVDWITQFDVCLLPSFFLHESTPNALIEYLLCDKPVIATNYVEIPGMMSEKEQIAGILIDLVDGKAPVEKFHLAMKEYLINPTLLTTHGKIAAKLKKNFDIEICAESYTTILQNARTQKKELH